MKRGPSERYALTEEQLSRLWAVCKTPEDQVLVGLMAYEGLRVREACHVQASWIINNEINIPLEQKCSCTDCMTSKIHPGVWRTKTKAGARVLPVVPIMQSILLGYLQVCPKGLPFGRIQAWRRIKRLAGQAKIPYLSPHILRATAATNFARAGFKGQELCVVMGWARYDMGAHYVQLIQSRDSAKKAMMNVYRAT